MKQRIAIWKVRLLQRRSAWMHLWHERTARERHALLGAAAVIAVALFYLILIAPALEGRAQLQRSLPQLRLQAAQLHALSDEATALPASTDAPAMLSRPKLEAVLRQQGLKAQNINLNGDSVRLQFDDAPFAQLIECLDTLQKTQQLVVVDAAFSAKDKPGMVGATLQLNRQNHD